ncbi:sulfur carrier protein ThiS [Corynebacterium callunae]|uniref:sulfur carrier protein ThiS n=1 Tax=Corynebacterium callunae TaxID=1721 RepID=UPI00398290EE
MIPLTLNGSATVATATTVEDLVHGEVGTTEGVAVAINARVLPRSQWSRVLNEGDQVDILSAAQGG